MGISGAGPGQMSGTVDDNILGSKSESSFCGDREGDQLSGSRVHREGWKTVLSILNEGG